ncbi:ComEC/Rec2 family competence protein, partial [Arthrobacter sp. GN70]|uniref:ComEC/Rec2 family competence protein n=1 Tax=Arthrobacter sp. GN70 TaxID=2838876 RepID=UPI001BFD2465
AANGMLNRSRTKILVTGGVGWDRVVPGQIIRTAGKLKPAWPGQTEAGVLAASTGPLPPDLQPRHEAGQDNAVSPALFKEQFSAAAEWLGGDAEWLGGDAAGLMPGMVTGDTSRLDESLETAMKTTGTTHLTAVSGETVTKVYGSILGN